jgi:hypothetical protein
MATKNPFVRDLEEVQKKLGRMASGQKINKAIEWTMVSASFKILKEIRKPEGAGGWPIDTRESYKKWGFEKVKINGGRFVFQIFNDAPALRGRLQGHAYAGWVYAKGDGTLRRPIAPGIINRAIIATLPTIRSGFKSRIDKYLSKGAK